MTGALVPLGDVAHITTREGPALVSREHLKRRIYIGFNSLGLDIESLVHEVKKKIDQLGGSFKNMERAMAPLRIVVPITIALIFFLLFSSLNIAAIRVACHLDTAHAIGTTHHISLVRAETKEE